jgi:acetyl/propionyl-CoA carboxylase alpha subunit
VLFVIARSPTLRDDEAIPPFDKLRAPSPVEGLDHHGRSAGQQNGARADRQVIPASKAAKDAKLLTLEAMKMQTTVYAPAAGIVDEALIQVGDTVQSKDLLLHLRAK